MTYPLFKQVPVKRTHQERPLGELSTYVVEQMPEDTQLGTQHDLGRLTQAIENARMTYMKNLCTPRAMEIALLDLTMLERSLIHQREQATATGRQTSDTDDVYVDLQQKVVEMVDDLAQRLHMLPTITYEGVVLHNPPGDRRTFTGGAVGSSEADFYELHRRVEVEGKRALRHFRNARAALMRGAPAQAATELNAAHVALQPIIELVRSVGADMPKDHFAEFRQFLTPHPTRGLKGPSGAFTAFIPTVDILFGGTLVPTELFDYVRDNRDYFPRDGQRDLDAAVAIAHDRTSINDLCIRLGCPLAVVEAMNALDADVSHFRRNHYNAVARQIPGALQGQTAGTAGEGNVRLFLQGRRRITHVTQPESDSRELTA